MPLENNSSVTEPAARVHVAHEMRNLRLSQGLTQRELAAALAIKPAMLSHIECANHNVSYETAHAALDLAREHFRVGVSPRPAPAEVDSTPASTDVTRAKLAADVRAYRHAHTLTYKDLARYFDISKGHLYRVYTGQGAVSPELIARLTGLMRTAPTIRLTGRGYAQQPRRARPVVSDSSATQPAVTPTPAAPTPAAPTPTRTEMQAAFLRLDDTGLRSPLTQELSFDGVTPHYFLRTPDNGVIILRPKA